MLIKDLIEQLKTMPQDMEVLIQTEMELVNIISIKQLYLINFSYHNKKYSPIAVDNEGLEKTRAYKNISDVNIIKNVVVIDAI